jgi:hypothetical protein
LKRMKEKGESAHGSHELGEIFIHKVFQIVTGPRLCPSFVWRLDYPDRRAYDRARYDFAGKGA